MKRIYGIRYEKKWAGSREWSPDSVRVLCGPDANQAVEKAKRYALKQTYKDEQTGKVEKVVGFRMTSVTFIASAQI